MKDSRSDGEPVPTTHRADFNSATASATWLAVEVIPPAATEMPASHLVVPVVLTAPLQPHVRTPAERPPPSAHHPRPAARTHPRATKNDLGFAARRTRGEPPCHRCRLTAWSVRTTMAAGTPASQQIKATFGHRCRDRRAVSRKTQGHVGAHLWLPA